MYYSNVCLPVPRCVKIPTPKVDSVSSRVVAHWGLWAALFLHCWMQREHVHQKRRCTNQGHILLPGMGTLLFSHVVICWNVEPARWPRLQLKNATSGAFIIQYLHVGAERQRPRYQKAFFVVKGIHSRCQCGGGTLSHACESLYSWILHMDSKHAKFALTAKKPDVVAFLLSQKANVRAED